MGWTDKLKGAVVGGGLGAAAGGLSPLGFAAQGPGAFMGAKSGWGGGMTMDRSIGARKLADSEISGNRDPGALEGQGRRREMLLRGANYVKGREGAEAGMSAFRARQKRGLNMLEQQARGEGPSIARQQAQESLQRGVSAQQALAAGARPGQQAAAARQASQQGSLLAGSVAGASALGRAQEQIGAQQNYMSAVGQARGMDQNINLANLQAEMQQRGMNDAQQRALLEMELRNAGMAQQGQLGQAGLRQGYYQLGMGQPTSAERYLSAIEGGISNISKGISFMKPGMFGGGGGGGYTGAAGSGSAPVGYNGSITPNEFG